MLIQSVLVSNSNLSSNLSSDVSNNNERIKRKSDGSYESLIENPSDLIFDETNLGTHLQNSNNDLTTNMKEQNTNNNIHLNAQSLSISSPDISTVWIIDNLVTITWTSSGIAASEDIRINLFKNSAFQFQISISKNNGSYTWRVPSNLANSSTYTIRLELDSNPTIKIDSPNFIIDNPTIIVLSPENNVVVTTDSFTNISWIFNGPIDHDFSNVTISLIKNGSLNSIISSSTFNNGSYIWHVPISGIAIGFGYTIRIEPNGFSNLATESSSFYIDKPSIFISTPTNNAKLVKDTTANITWTFFSSSTGVYSQVNIFLFLNGSLLLSNQIASSVSNDGQFEWKIPTSLVTGSGYTIKIEVVADSTINEMSSSFTIENPTISIIDGSILPGAKITLIIDNIVKIEWQFTGDPTGYYGTVSIYLYGNGSSLITSIAASIPNNGSISWRVIEDITGSGYYFKIEISSDTSINDDSNPFDLDYPSIILNEVNTNNQLVTDTSYNITWQFNFDTSNLYKNVSLKLLSDNSFLTYISVSTANDGSFIWQVPVNIGNGSFSIQISIINMNFINDTKTVSIEDPKLNINLFSDGITLLLVNQSLDITWTFTGITTNAYSDVKVDLYANGSYYQTLIMTTPNDGSDSILITSDLTGIGYAIVISVVNYANINDTSVVFTILNPVIQSETPIDDAHPGDNLKINWSFNGNSTGNFSNVSIDLYNSSSYITTIIESTPNNGSFNWIVGNFAPGIYKFKIQIFNSTIFFFTNTFSILEVIDNTSTSTTSTPQDTSTTTQDSSISTTKSSLISSSTPTPFAAMISFLTLIILPIYWKRRE